jgi:hypothetical protein
LVPPLPQGIRIFYIKNNILLLKSQIAVGITTKNLPPAKCWGIIFLKENRQADIFSQNNH